MSRSKSSYPEIPIPADPTAVSDLYRIYLVALGREPESAHVVQVMSAHPFDMLTSLLFGSPEFSQRMESLLSGDDPFATLPPPGVETAAWVARRLPLSRISRAQVEKAAWSWSALFLALAHDDAFVKASGAETLGRPEVIQALSFRARVRGAVERADAQVVSGWALRHKENDEPARLELWVDGTFSGATIANRFRRDVQDLIGGDGHVGFIFYLPPRASTRADALVEVRLVEEDVVLGAHRVRLGAPRIDELTAIRSEIALLRAGLERLERSLPMAVDVVGGGQLSAWADYFDAWYADLEVQRPDSGRWAVVIDTAEAEPAHVQASLAAIVAQVRTGDRVLLVATPDQLVMATDLARKARLLGAADFEIVKTSATDPADRLRAALARARGLAFTLLVRAGDVLGQAALALLTRRFQQRPAARAIYVDEDRLDPTGPSEGFGTRHADPILKPGPDPDLLLQTPYVGCTLAYRTSVFDKVPFTRGLDGLHGPDLLLRLLDIPATVEHLPLVLVTRTVPDMDYEDQARVWRSAVAAHLASRDECAMVLNHSDILGAVQPGALLIRRTPPAGAQATLIIPTRDRLDLLVPCLESLFANRAANATAMNILVIDHESRERSTLRYLTGLRGQNVQVLRYEGPFNWALMNNAAASNVESDVLVFMNNDTVVLAPEWLDALVAQALRREVGVVGCRLVYGDGTLQHAGCVTRGQHPGFVFHEGVGTAGSDGGYLGRHALTHASSMVTGACLAVANEVFRSLGGFDAANFPVEGNDADFCFKAREAGLRVLYEPQATLYHLESKSRGFSSSGEKRRVAEAAARLLRERWGQKFGDDPTFNPHFDRRSQPFERLGAPALTALGG